MSQKQGQIQSWTLGEAMAPFYCLFHVRSFLIQQFAIGNITTWEGPWPPRSFPCSEKRRGQKQTYERMKAYIDILFMTFS